MEWTNLLGIYPNAIEKVFETCRDAIDDIRDFAKKLGYDKDAECLDFDLDEAVLDCLASNGLDVRDMTNSLINACFFVTQGELENTRFCKDFELTFDTYTNCDDSHLYIEHNGATEEYNGEGDMNSLLNEILAQQLCDIICDRLIDSGELSKDDLTEERVQELRDYISEDIDRFDDSDIAACYCEWQITGAIRETVDYVLSTQREAEHKPSVERD